MAKKQGDLGEKDNLEGLSRKRFLYTMGVLAAGTVVAGGAFGTGTGSIASAAEPAIVTIDGKEVKGPVPASIVKGTVVAPVRAIALAMGAQVAWENKSKTVRISSPGVNNPSKQGQSTSITLPFPYKKLDPAVVRKRGYENYFKGGCMYASASAILSTLQEAVGSPYDTIPLDMFKYGAGGVSGWGTLCGALNGAAAVMNLATKSYGPLVNELMGWYTEFPFPSKNHEAYCKYPGQIQSVCKSPLCHASVSLWSAASGKKVNSDEKKDRCGKLSGDTAAYAVELLNKQFDGQFIAAYKPSEEFAHCLGCHNGGKSLLDNEQGLMNCIPCHEPHGM